MKNGNEKKILGIHHVTAIAGDPQRNIDFYTRILGLRLVKLTVNYDDPDTYHLYYGDKTGHPGTILTFFPWPGAPRGRRGTGQATVTSFLIPEDSVAYWLDRLKQNNVKFEEPARRFKNEEECITFFDPDDLKLELIASSAAGNGKYTPWEKTPVPERNAICGFHGITLSEEGYERTASLLKDTMGFRLVREEGERFRYEAGEGGASTYVDLLCQPALPRGEVLAGTVHHVAWRTPDDDQQKAWRREVVRAGLNPTPVIDRQYFHSVYFREPGGVLFEIATDPPGFAIDEPEDMLGTTLKLPPWLEPSRKHIEHALPKLQLTMV
ncbi:MAG: ring-cleaving dioxygenase [Nitrososphaerales archaeon]